MAHISGATMTYFETGALAALMLCALMYGFTGTVPRFGHKAVKGAALVCLGVVAVFTKIEFVAAAMLVANGTRMAWLEACKVSEVDYAARENRLRSAGDQGLGGNSQPGLGQATAGAIQRYGKDHRNGDADSAEAAEKDVPASIEELNPIRLI
jgi:hypothetical protein